MGKPTASSILETAPPSMITVHKRTPSQKRLDTILEETATFVHFEPELSGSFGSMTLEWSSSVQSPSPSQRLATGLAICA